MKQLTSCGVIVEYNPLHNGHRYHLQSAREKSGADVLVAVMSGNFVQRGEPALLNKQVRTQLALQAGIDLVIELPWFGAVQAADYFAKTSITLLQALKVDSFCFGTDSDTDFDYQQFARLEKEKQSEIDRCFQQINREQPNWSYPVKLQAVYQQLFPDLQLDLAQPNHVLGLTYARWNERLSRPMKLYTVQRTGSQHNDQHLHQLASGTAIRQAVLNNQWEELASSVPAFTLNALQNEKRHTWDLYFPLLKARCLTMTIAELQAIYQMVDGLEYKIKEVSLTANSMDEWVNALKSKRYTYARLQRLGIYILLNVTRAEINSVSPYLRVLGFNERGRAYLKQTTATLPVISNLRQQEQSALMAERKWDGLYLGATGDGALFAKDYHPISV